MRGCPRPTHSTLIIPGALPGHQLTDGRAGARDRVLVRLHLGVRGFFADSAEAESNFLLFRIHLDDLEVELLARLEVSRLAVGVHGFGIVT